ncbi:hypothetical protein HHK36_029208 [Tetracentron sinense]|uniref:Uncharacterized protein n=1 Tax=Tetracentron sinense TaxID=13715 RepID=A0A834YEH7_TETSI|nr:hypothetical protein HHK36_029208 [Tetracentron sinense]
MKRLLVFVGYMVVDTQDIIEKAHLGDLDYVKHALTLFTDFATVFVRILIRMGCYVATRQGCWGILNGPATGAAVAELVLDGWASIADLTPFSPSRFVSSRKL